ncbi:hypothetical protein Landi51_08266 [Colletotrichum acutatum]
MTPPRIAIVLITLIVGSVQAESCKCFNPPGSVCYTSQPDYNQEACDSLIVQYSTWAFNSANPASMGTKDACDPIYPNGTSIFGDTHAGATGCSLGTLSPYVVNATEAGHVKAALQFAEDHNLRLNIKNTGHGGKLRNCARRSSAPGSLSIWTHHMKYFVFHETFQPVGCLNTSKRDAPMAATIGAGLQDGELFEALAGHNAFGTGGTNTDVGVVGWSTGEGHGFMTGAYGQGADNIIEASVVTPSGDVVVTNECQHEDLFWAIRGGGGGTFGVILNLTLKAYPMPNVTLFGINAVAKNGTSPKSWWEFVARFHTIIPALQDQGLHGYWSMDAASRALGGSFFLWNADNATVARVTAPLQEFFKNSSDSITYTAAPIKLTTFYDLVKQLPTLGDMSRNSATSASRLVSRDLLTQNQTAFAETLEKLAENNVESLTQDSISFSGTMTISSKPVNNSLNPVWRRASIHLIASQSYPATLSSIETEKVVSDMTFNKLNLLRELDPSSGAYLNEANDLEPGWQWSFFGENYGRLFTLKNRYDPNGLLWCNKCVGSEQWVTVKNGSLCPAYAFHQ